LQTAAWLTPAAADATDAHSDTAGALPPVTLALLRGGCEFGGFTMAPPAGQSVARLVVGVPLYALTVLPPSDTGADDGRGEDIRVVVGGGGGAARTGVANRIVCFFFFWCQGGGVGESLFLAPCCHGHALTGRTPRLFPVAPLDVFPHRAGAQEVHAYSPVDSGKCKATPHPPDDDGGASRFALCGAMPLADAPLAVAAPTVVAAPGGAAPAPADVRVLAAVGAQLSELIFDEQRCGAAAQLLFLSGVPFLGCHVCRGCLLAVARWRGAMLLTRWCIA